MAVVDGRAPAVARPARGLAGEEGVDPVLGALEGLGRRVLDRAEQLGRVERQRHRRGLQRRLAAEQVGERAARLARAGGERVRVEPRERADGERAAVQRAGVVADALEDLELRELDVAAAGLVARERGALAWGGHIGQYYVRTVRI